MTVSSTTTKAQYSGNGTTTVFAVPFYFLLNSDLLVILRSSAGVETTQVLTTNYTVTGAGNESGGSITMLVAPPTGTTLTILRNAPATQETDLIPNDRLPAESLEDALDKLTMLVQQLDEENNRALKFATTDSTASTTLPTSPNRAGKFLSFDNNGNPIVVGATDTYTINEEVKIATQGQTVFTLTTMTYTPGINNLAVFVDGVNQYRGSSYTETSPTVVTFSQGLHVGAVVKFSTVRTLNSDASGADAIQFLQSGTGALSRSVQNKLRDTVSVKDFGAAGDGVTDDTAAIQAAINSSARVILVPTGTYRVDGTISLQTFKTLQIEGTLSRLSAYSSSTRPLVLINNVQHAEVCGNGALVSQNATIDGLICIGPEDPSVPANQFIDVQWCAVDGLSLTGAGLGASNIGVMVQCTAAYGGANVCYQNWIRNLEINSVGSGIYFGSQSNANMISQINMWNIGVYGINFAGNDGSPSGYPTSSITDNIVSGLFINNSFSLTASLRCVQASFNVFHGMHGEPGGGRLFTFDANSESNYLTGIENHSQAGINLGQNNTIITNATIANNAPRFLAYLPASVTNATGDGTAVNINYSTEIFDTWPGGAFGSGAFTCPLNGKYRMSGTVYLTGLTSSHTSILVELITSNRTYIVYFQQVGSQSLTSASIPWTALADMEFGDTALVRVTVSGSTKTVSIYGDATTATSFAGEFA